MTICVIPAYRAAETVVDVVRSVLPFVDMVIVVDDFCPEECGLIVNSTFALASNVEVLRHQANRGVGGAVKTGIRRALELRADVIVKLDADGQMDAQHIPEMVRILAQYPRLALVKGNRFFDGSVVGVMPGARLFGNSALTLLVRMASGYWNSIDPTNGYLAIRAERLRRMGLDRLDDRYFFEISLLCRFGMRRAEIAELDIPARYNGERSSLSLCRVIVNFPRQLIAVFFRRLIWQYVVSDMSVGSLLLVAGTALMTAAGFLGAYWWQEALHTGVPRTPGTIGIVLVPLVMGFQMLLSAVLYDVQSAPRTLKFAWASSTAYGSRRVLEPLDRSPVAPALEAFERERLTIP